MATISLCMIVKNESAVLARCLESIAAAVDEIIIVDTGSTDDTREIAGRYTTNIYDFPWIDDFSAARNFAFSKATMDYQMWLDADDVFSDADALQRLKQTLTADVVMLPYHIAFDAAGNSTMTYQRERILRRACGFRWIGAVHEAITPHGEILHAEIAVLHRKEQVQDAHRNLRILEKQRTEHGTLTPREQYYYARELYYHGAYADAEVQFTEFLNSGAGWREDCIAACLMLAACALEQDDSSRAMTALFRSFLYDRPRADICCEIGRLWMKQSRWTDAIFWYEAALDAPVITEGFCNPDCHDYIPYMQLCVCYDRMGNLPQAAAYNDKAGRIKPTDGNVLANRRYFREKRNA